MASIQNVWSSDQDFFLDNDWLGISFHTGAFGCSFDTRSWGTFGRNLRPYFSSVVDILTVTLQPFAQLTISVKFEVEKSSFALMCYTLQQRSAFAINHLILSWRKESLCRYATLYVSNVSVVYVEANWLIHCINHRRVAVCQRACYILA